MSNIYFKKYLINCAKGGRKAQSIKESERLSGALKYGTIRPIESTLWFVVVTFNPFSGNLNYIELTHEQENGNDRWHT